MEPISIIVTALTLGAAAGLKPTAEVAVKDAYAGLKKIILDKYSQAIVGVNLIEQNPSSEAYKSAAKEMLDKTDVAQDELVLGKVKELLDSIQSYASEDTDIIGVNLEDIRGASLIIDNIIAAGTGVQVKSAKFIGDVKIKDVRAGFGKDYPPKKNNNN
jgi:hypothetical protein